MKTDDQFYEFFRRYPEVLLKLAQLPTEGRWAFESITIKSTEKRIDGFLTRQDVLPSNFIFVELQGYKEEGFYWRFFREISTWFEQNPEETRPFIALAVFLRRSHDARNRRLSPVKPDRFMRVYLSDVLKALEHEPGPWVVLEPLVLSNRKTLLARGPVWRETLKTLPLPPEDLKMLQELLTLSLMSRFKTSSRKEIVAMFQLTPLEETRAGRELLEEGRQEGRQEGIKEGIKEGRQEGIKEGIKEGRQEGQKTTLQRVLRQLLQQRFGALPPAVSTRLESIQDLNILEAMTSQVLSVRSLDDLQWA